MPSLLPACVQATPEAKKMRQPHAPTSSHRLRIGCVLGAGFDRRRLALRKVRARRLRPAGRLTCRVHGQKESPVLAGPGQRATLTDRSRLQSRPKRNLALQPTIIATVRCRTVRYYVQLTDRTLSQRRSLKFRNDLDFLIYTASRNTPPRAVFRRCQSTPDGVLNGS